MYLIFVNELGPNYKGENIYEFIFSENIDELWGEDWDSVPAHGKPGPPETVYINKVGTYSFLYESTASLGGTTSGETYVEAMAAATLDSPVRLDIQPVAWSGSAGLAKGDVTSFNVDRGYYDIEVVPPLKESVYIGSYTDMTIDCDGGASSKMRITANNAAASYNTKFEVDELIVLRGSVNPADDGVYKVATVSATQIDCTTAGPSGLAPYTTNPKAKIFSFDENKLIRILQGRVTRSGSASPYRSVDFTS